jgi:hypothetical protein
MMSRLSSQPRRVRRPAASAVIANARLPHPSWRLSGETATGERTLSAEDFWQKLGL